MRLFETVFILLFVMLWNELDCVKTRSGKKSSPDQATQRSFGASQSFSSRDNIVIALPANRRTAGVETGDEGTTQTARRRGRLSEEGRRAQQEYIMQNRRITRSQFLREGAVHSSAPQPTQTEINYAPHNQQENAEYSQARQFDQGEGSRNAGSGFKIRDYFRGGYNRGTEQTPLEWAQHPQLNMSTYFVENQNGINLIVDLNGLQLGADHVMPAVGDDTPPLGTDLPAENIQQNNEGHQIRQGRLNIDLNGPPPADDE